MTGQASERSGGGALNLSATDTDGNGLVDGSERSAYAIDSNGDAITLTNWRGRTFRDSTTRNWNVVQAVAKEDASGFHILLEGQNRRAGRHYIWETDTTGRINRGSGWKTPDQLLQQGYEELFQRDFNGDDSIGFPEPEDTDANGITDGSESYGYAIHNDGDPITLTNWRGRTFRDSTTRNWNVVQAVAKEDASGFHILLEGQNRRAGRHYIWETDTTGRINRGSGWKTPDQLLQQGYEELFQRDFNGDDSIGFPEPEDTDANGITDGSESYGYAIHNDGDPITLTNWRGRTFRDSTTRNWNVVQAVAKEDASGFHILLEGQNRRAGRHYIWETDTTGRINRGSGWKTPDQLLQQGYEELFQRDFNGDGGIGRAVDDGDAAFTITGTPEPDQVLSVTLTDDDPDGNGQTLITWQTSADGNTWDDLSSDDTLTITDDLAGLSIRASIAYTDGEGFEENVLTDPVVVPEPPVDDGDAAFTITGTPEPDQVLSVTLTDDDPDGNGQTLITWQTSADGNTWDDLSSDDTLTITDDLAGLSIRASIAYTDGEGFEENVLTDPVVVPEPPVDDGDAAFTITGTPEPDQVLSVTLTDDDPDGNGQTLITWQTSADGNTWDDLSSDDTLTITNDLAGLSIRASIAYTDGEGFEENVLTDPVVVPEPPVDDGDAAFTITGTPEPDQVLSVTLTDDDPDGNGQTLITWQTSADGNTWDDLSSDDTLTITNDLAGLSIRASIAYTDGEGFEENVLTDAVVVPEPPVDDGDAAFTITGTPEPDQVLSVTLTDDDPDGNGQTLITWQTSADGNTWDDLSSDDTLTITDDLAGLSIRASIAYTDGEGFEENVLTDPVVVPEPPVDDGDDYGTSPDTSGNLSIGINSQGNLEQTADRDWFSIDLKEGTRVQVDLIGDTLRDPLLRLRDRDGRLLTSDDDGGDGLNSRIIHTADTDAVLYLEAGAYADSQMGTYTLRAVEIAPPPEGFSSQDGFGHVNAKDAFEELLDITIPDVPSLGGNLWGLDNVNAPEIWSGSDELNEVTGEGVTVAVIDTGVDLDHPEFEGRISAGYDFVDDDDNADDGNSHGTHVAGTIAGSRDGDGITGVAPDASIMPIRVLDNDGYGWTSDIIAGIRWAAENGADVINLSLGGGGFSQSMADAIEFASELGAVVVMAAGNSGGDSPDYPAAHATDHGLAVGAVNQQRSMAGFSNRAGQTVLDYVTAPGVDIESAIPGGGYARYSGTSMATPHVAGVAALLKSHDNGLAPARIEDLLTQTASNNNGTNGQATQSSNNQDDGESNDNEAELITLETIKEFSSADLDAPLIGNLAGHHSKRETTAETIDALVESEQGDFADIDTFEVIEATDHDIALVDLSDDKDADRVGLLRDLLKSNQFEYFEFDQQLTTL